MYILIAPFILALKSVFASEEVSEAVSAPSEDADTRNRSSVRFTLRHSFIEPDEITLTCDLCIVLDFSRGALGEWVVGGARRRHRRDVAVLSRCLMFSLCHNADGSESPGSGDPR